MIKLCSKCNQRIDFQIVGNLHWCDSCGYILMGGTSPNKHELVSTDLRKLELHWDNGWTKIFSYVYQLDLLKIMNIANQVGASKYSELMEKIIKQIDRVEKRDTDFGRMDMLPRIFLKDHLDKR